MPRSEKEKLGRWLLSANLTAQAVSFLNQRVDRLGEEENEAQEHLWELEDEINSIQVKSYNAQEICDQLKEFVSTFPELSDGERKLLIDALIDSVVVKNKEVAVALTPPLCSFGLLSTPIAPRGIEPLFEE